MANRTRVEIGEGEKTYSTSDLSVASVLLSAGHELLEIEREGVGPRPRLKFIFANVDVQATLIVFGNDTREVKARTLLDNYRNLRSQVHNPV